MEPATQNKTILPPEEPGLSFAQITMGWIRENLFSSRLNSILTLFFLALLMLMVPPAISWVFIDAVWIGDGVTCQQRSDGACWPFIYKRWGQYLFGAYPVDQWWRVTLVLASFFIGLGLLALPILNKRQKLRLTLFLLIPYPVISWFLLKGGIFGLSEVGTTYWGGFTVTLIVSVVGIVASFPLGILLALGRRSEMPLVRSLSIIFIEFWRGIPLITVLFVGAYILSLFFPTGLELDQMIRALIAVTIFTAAYTAEVVRGGLQVIPKGQYEAAQALGLSYWRMMITIILPQALKVSIPNLVNSFIALFKDTTLLLIISIIDFLGAIQSSSQDPNWAAPNVAYTGYIFSAMVFWIFCFSMSRYSVHIERKLSTDRR